MRVLRQDLMLCQRTGGSTNLSIAAATTLEEQDLDVIMALTQSIEGGYESIYTEDIAVRSHVHLQSMQCKLSPYSHIQAN